MRKRLIVTPEKCIGCRSCEIACSFVHATTPNQPALSRVRVYPFAGERYVPVLCLQCEEAACVRVCPTQALTRDPDTLAVNLIREKCILCKACVTACPFGNIHLDETAGCIAKCDVCHGDPACAKFCPTEALVYAERPRKGTRPKLAAERSPLIFKLPLP